MGEKYNILIDDAVFVSAIDIHTLTELFGREVGGEYNMFVMEVSPANKELGDIIVDKLDIKKDYCSIKIDGVDMYGRVMDFDVYYLITNKKTLEIPKTPDNRRNWIKALTAVRIEDILKEEDLLYEIKVMGVIRSGIKN